MKSAKLIAVIAVLLAPVAARSAAAPVGGSGTGGEVPRLMEDVDKAIEQMKSVAWRMPDGLRNPKPTAEGHTLEQDIAEFLMTEATLKQIGELRDAMAAAIPAGSDRVPAAAIRPFTAVMQREFCRMSAVGAWWDIQGIQAFHLDLLDTLAARLPAPERSAWAPRIQAIGKHRAAHRETLREALSSCGNDSALPATDEVSARFDDLPHSANALRLELVRRISTLQPDLAADATPTRRPTACPPTAGGTTGTPRAQVRFRPDPYDYFPRLEASRRVEGRVRVGIMIDATGCVAEVIVLESSGSSGLDEGARQLAFAYQFTPGEIDGEPASAGFVLPVTFSIRDWPDLPAATAPGQPQP